MLESSTERNDPTSGNAASDRAIVVGYDGTHESSSALQWAITEALRVRSNLSVVACIDPRASADGQTCPDLAPVLTGATRFMATSQSQLIPDSFRLQVVKDVPWIRLAAESADGEMLVIGTSSHLLLGSWRLGAVTHELLQRATCPVVLVPRHDSCRRYGRIIVAVDGTTSHAALTWAARQAELRQTELIVVHAPEDRTQASAAVAEEVLDDACRSARRLTSQLVIPRLVDGPITTSLLSQAFHTDLLVLGTGGVHHAIGHSGSVAQAIAACATSPTVLIRQQIVDHGSR